MASIRKRGKFWQARVSRAGYKPQSRTFDTERDARIWAANVEAEMNRRVFVATREEEKTTLLSCLQRYGREITPAKKGADKEKHRLAIWKADPLAGRKIAQVTSADLAAWRDDRLKAGKSPSTVTNDLNLLSAVFEVARKEWGMPALLNPLKSVSRPKKPRARDRRLKEGEEEKLLAAAAADKNTWMQPLIILAIETAARRSELLQMRWKQIYFEDGVGQAIIEDSKNGEGREIPLSRRAVTTLKALKESYASGEGRLDRITGER